VSRVGAVTVTDVNAAELRIACRLRRVAPALALIYEEQPIRV
jgi:hypothetical protein